MKDTQAEALRSSNPAVAEAAQMAVESGLIYVSGSQPGLWRVRNAKGFHYSRPTNVR